MSENYSMKSSPHFGSAEKEVELEQLRRAAETGRPAPILNLFKFLRINKLRQTRDVVRWGRVVLEKYRSHMGDELWTVLEQVMIAALDLHDTELSKECLKELQTKFPDSARVKRLEGMQSEALGEWGAAKEIYKQMLEENPANTLAMKRQVCVLKAQGNYPQAIRQLNEYLTTFGADTSAWQELGEMYMAISKYEAAVFCYEELILSNPTNHIHHCRLGELYYTLGPKHVRTARKYFAQSLDLKKDGNLRAMHGLASCCRAIMASPDRKTRADVTSALDDYAVGELIATYTEKNPAMLPKLNALLEI